MKRQILWAATAGIALAGCTHVECPGTENAQTPKTTQSEITVNPFGRKMSRGIVSGTELRENNHTSRTFYMSAYNATEGTDYFIGKTFGEKVDEEGYGTGLWGAVKLNTEATPPASSWTEDPVYWPFGAKLDFLAYSQSYDEAASSNPCPKIYANWKSANEVELEVTKESRQDDILYAATSGLNSSNSNSTIGFSMIFNHAQAWLTFKLKLTEGSTGELTINSIKCANIYSGGRLTLRNEGDGNASADWHFFPLTPSDVTVADSEGLPGPSLSTTPIDLDILLPPQEHNGFIINYTLSGRTCNLEIPVSQLMNTSGNTWEAGKHYTYTFSFTLNEITVAPFITAWESTTDNWEEDNKYVDKLRGIETWLKTNPGGFEYITSFDNPTVNDIAHLTIPTQTSKYPTPTEYIALLNKILEGLHSSDVEPHDFTVTNIMYKGDTYAYSDWHLTDEDTTLGKKIYDDMMESGLYTAILTLDGVQTIEIHLSEINLYHAKLQNAMRRTLQEKDAAEAESILKALHDITYTSSNNCYNVIFDSAKLLTGDGVKEEAYRSIKPFFSYLASDDVLPYTLEVENVKYDDVNYNWVPSGKFFGKADGTDSCDDTGNNFLVTLLKLIQETSYTEGTTHNISLDDDQFSFNMTITQQTVAP